MTWAKLPASFSSSEIVLKIEQRFGLLGYARLVKLLELLGASETAAAGIISLRESDWLEALQANSTELYGLLNYLRQAQWAEYAKGDEQGQPLVVTLLQPEAFRAEAVGPLFFTKAVQWSTWCQAELGMTREVVTDPYTQQLFRRWAASHVTLEEMRQAETLAADLDKSLAPSVLHRHLTEIRKAALAKAYR